MSHCVYRHYDINKNLLYVGITNNLFGRTMQHEQTATWYNDISLITVEHFVEREEAINKESLYIKELNPKHNITLNPKRDFKSENELRIKKASLWINNEWQNPPKEISMRSLRYLTKIGIAEFQYGSLGIYFKRVTII